MYVCMYVDLKRVTQERDEAKSQLASLEAKVRMYVCMYVCM